MAEPESAAWRGRFWTKAIGLRHRWRAGVALAAQPEKPAAFALILRLLNLPGQDGLALCVDIRKNSRTPIGFVASRDSTNGERRALSLGERRKAI